MFTGDDAMSVLSGLCAGQLHLLWSIRQARQLSSLGREVLSLTGCIVA